MQKIVNIEATTLPDAWFQVIYNIVEHGRTFIVESGSFCGETRKELDFVVIQIKRPWERDVDGLPLIPEMPEGSNVIAPVTKDYIADYAPYLMTGEVAENESYTYGQRLNDVPLSKEYKDEMLRLKDEIYVDHCGNKALEDVIYEGKGLSQVQMAIEVFKKSPRTNQMCMQIGAPEDMTLIDPPCLRTIDSRVQDGKLHFYVYFRSWDAWSGLPANLAGISLLQEHMASEIGIEQGEIIATSKGLHVYGYAEEMANLRCMLGDDCVNGS